MWAVEFGGLYRFAKWPLEEKMKRSALTMEAMVGGRYWNLFASLDLSIPLAGVFVDTSGRKEWIDPFVGVRMRLDLSNKFSVSLRGDVGVLMWARSLPIMRWAWGLEHLTGGQRLAGYRVLGLNYESGSGLNKFKFDGAFYGPITGIVFRF